MSKGVLEVVRLSTPRPRCRGHSTGGQGSGNYGTHVGQGSGAYQARQFPHSGKGWECFSMTHIWTLRV
jgi:hypothetical protein